MTARRYASRCALLVVIGVGGTHALADGTSPVGAAAPPTVSVVEAVRRDIAQTVTVTGTLVPRDEVLVSPEIDGVRVSEVLVEEGARVRRGQVLARLSRELVDRQIAEQDATVAKAAAAVPQAEDNIEQSDAAEVEARLSLERARSLMATGNTTAAVMESRTSALRQAASRHTFAHNGLAMAKADLAQARAMRDELGLRLARTEVRAPVDGIVSRRTARVGLAASASAEPLFRLIARGEIELEGEVLEDRLPSLREGLPAEIELGDGPRIRGEVRAVYPEVDKASRLGKVRIRLAADPRLRIGAFARGAIEVARTRGIVLPQAAILYGGPRRSGVLVVSGGRVEDRAVETGLVDGDGVEIRSGLAEGERVVARAGSFLRDGDRVRPTPDAGAGRAPVDRPRSVADAGTP